jgi:hypothetical protein
MRVTALRAMEAVNSGRNPDSPWSIPVQLDYGARIDRTRLR